MRNIKMVVLPTLFIAAALLMPVYANRPTTVTTLNVSAAVKVASPIRQVSQIITVTVLPGEDAAIKGTDGLHHDMVVPSNFVIYRGQKVTLIIYNYDEGPHTITCSALGLNILITPATKPRKVPSKTVFSFTVRKKGTFRWRCMIPCDGGGQHWAMSKSKNGLCQNGYMAGYFIVL